MNTEQLAAEVVSLVASPLVYVSKVTARAATVRVAAASIGECRDLVHQVKDAAAACHGRARTWAPGGAWVQVTDSGSALCPVLQFHAIVFVGL